MLNKEAILHIAALSKLSFTDRECELFQKDMNEITDFVSEMADASNEIKKQVSLDFESLREDVQNKTLSREDIFSNATQSTDGFFSVSKVISNE